MRPEHYDVVVIGGGQAGLAIGYHLAQQGRRFTILEAAGEPASAWRGRWDSLRLFTSVRYDSLPGLDFPGDPDSYPGRDDVIAYLTDYAQRFELPVEFNSRVQAVRARDGGGFVVELADRLYEADQVVVATGPFQVPFTPPVAAGLGSEVVQLHSTRYRSPDDLPTGTVLVVGGGNTGYQISEELAQSRQVHLAIGARQMPLPQRILGRDLFRYLHATGLMYKTVDSRLARRLKDKETLIGSSPRAARKRGIQLRPRATAAQGRSVTFADGSELAVDGVVWATGFRLDHSFVQLPVFDELGAVTHRRGVTDVPGVYFLGLLWQHTRGSALLGWVKDDAQFIAQRIDAFAQEPRDLVGPAGLRGGFAMTAIPMSQPRPADPIGSIGWTERTGGVLTARECLTLARPLLRGELGILAGRLAMALRMHSGRRSSIDPASLVPPDSALARDAEVAAQDLLTPALLNHSSRAYTWGAAIAALHGITFDRELLYLAAMLHDTGIPSPVPDVDFTVRSAAVAREFTDSHEVPADKRELVANAIAMHHTPGVGLESGAEAYLLSAGASVDVFGLRSNEIPDAVRQSVIQEYPRLGFKREFAGLLRAEAKQVPRGRAWYLHRFAMSDLSVRLAPFRG